MGHGDMSNGGGIDYAHPILMSTQFFKTTGAPVIHDSTFQKSHLFESSFEFQFFCNK